MSKKSSKLMEISEMFDEININFDELSKDGINDIIAIQGGQSHGSINRRRERQRKDKNFT